MADPAGVPPPPPHTQTFFNMPLNIPNLLPLSSDPLGKTIISQSTELSVLLLITEAVPN